MNLRAKTPPLVWAGTLAALVAVVILTNPVSTADTATALYRDRAPVSYATVKTILEARCTTCHAQTPSSPMFQMPPQGVTLDAPVHVKRHAERVFVRSVATRTMPLGNLTGMTDEERALVGAWFAQGSNTEAPGPSAISSAAPAALAIYPTDAGEADKALAYFNVVCFACHGLRGEGNGPASLNLTPKPRDFTSADWQKSVTDDHIRRAILEGGGAVGKSETMPANPSLAAEPEVVDGLVKLIRSFSRSP
jgi:mono/diheme cytochrome c family protein